jgi:hypothetical protein
LSALLGDVGLVSDVASCCDAFITVSGSKVLPKEMIHCCFEAADTSAMLDLLTFTTVKSIDITRNTLNV